MLTLVGVPIANALSAPPTYTKFWLPLVLVGPLPGSERLKYYVEPQLRLIDDSTVFNEFFALGGFGYKFNKRFYLFGGPGWVVTQVPAGPLINEYRFWEQLNYELVDSLRWSVHNRTRLEERQTTGNTNTAVRLRERLWVRIPLHWADRYSLSCFDEVFFNLNHPTWVSPQAFAQNRAFVGISYNFTHSMVVDFGYLNQYFRDRDFNHYDNVIMAIFSITLEPPVSMQHAEE